MSDLKYNIYRLINGKTEGSFSIPRAMVEVEGVGLQYINYFPGGKSILESENEGRMPESVYFDESNQIDPLQIVVPVSNKQLNDFLQKHPMFGKEYEVFSEDIQAQRNIEKFQKVNKAFSLIDATNPIKIQSTALVVYGMEVYGASATICQAKLMETAQNSPDLIIDKIEKNAEYEGNFIAAMAFYSNIVKENDFNTAVVWADGLNAEIVQIPVGDKGVEVLGQFLSRGTEASTITMQKIGQKLEGRTATTTNVEDVISEKDKEIAELKKLLAEKNNPAPVATTETLVAITEEVKEVVVVDSETVGPIAPSEKDIEISLITKITELDEATAAYKKKFHNEPPVRYKNDAEWMKKKIIEAIQED